MPQVSRRDILWVPVGLAMAGCTLPKSLTDANVQKFIDNFSTIADAVVALLPTIKTVSGVSTKTVTAVNTVISGIKSVGSEVKSLVTTTAGLPLVQRLEAGVSDLSTLLVGFKLPAWVSTAFSDIAVAMPLVKTAVGLLVPMAGAPGESEAAMLRLRVVAATVVVRP